MAVPWRCRLALDFDFGGSWVGFGVAAAFEEVGDFQAEIAGIGGVAEGRIEIDDAGAQQFLEFAVKVLHAVSVAVAHGVEQSLAFAFAFFDVVAGTQSGF